MTDEAHKLALLIFVLKSIYHQSTPEIQEKIKLALEEVGERV